MVYVDMFCASVGLSTTYGISIFVWFLALCRVVEKFNVHSWDLKSLAFRRLLPVSKGDGALPTDRPYPLRHQVPPGVDHQVPQEAVTRRRRPPAPPDRAYDLCGAGGRDPQGPCHRDSASEPPTGERNTFSNAQLTGNPENYGLSYL